MHSIFSQLVRVLCCPIQYAYDGGIGSWNRKYQSMLKLRWIYHRCEFLDAQAVLVVVVVASHLHHNSFFVLPTKRHSICNWRHKNNVWLYQRQRSWQLQRILTLNGVPLVSHLLYDKSHRSVEVEQRTQRCEINEKKKRREKQINKEYRERKEWRKKESLVAPAAH